MKTFISNVATASLFAFTAACARPPLDEPLAPVAPAKCEPGVHHEKATITRNGDMLTISAPKQTLVPDGQGNKICQTTIDTFACNTAKIKQCTEKNMPKLLDPKFTP